MEFLEVMLPQDAEAVVVACEICSSSNIVAQLFDTGQQAQYAALLEKMKHYLTENQVKMHRRRPDCAFAVCRFTGDGWILLFPARETTGGVIDGGHILEFMRSFSAWFKRTLNEIVAPHLDAPPPAVGITFGVDAGPVHRVTISGQHEYIGPSIHIASGLQSAVRDKDRSPAYKALVSQPAFDRHFAAVTDRKVKRVWRNLRNIQGGAEFECSKIYLRRKGSPQQRWPFPLSTTHSA